MNIKYFVLISAFAGLVLLWSCQQPKPANTANAAVPVTVYRVQQEVATYFETHPASLVARDQVEVRSEVNGFITAVFFKEGASVRKGQKLYEIERAKYAAAYNQAAANVQIAESNLSKSQKDAARYTRLNQAEAVIKQRFEYALTDLENAQQQVALTKAQLASTNADLQHSVIAAPFAGTIGISQVKQGTFITAGQTQLSIISADNPIAVDIMVDEKQMSQFINWYQKPAAAQDSVFTILLPDNSLYPYPGQISFIDRAVDPQTGTIRVRFSFPNAQNKLKVGMSCNLRVRHNAGKKELLAPFKAITEQMGEYFIYTVQSDTARQRRVELGGQLGNKIVVLSGLKAGEQIVLEGIQKLREGTAVKINNSAQTASRPAENQPTVAN